MDQEYTRDSWRQAYGDLLRAFEERGLPAEVGKLFAKNLRSERSIRRMISYLRNARPTSMEEIADELIAIMEDREHWIQKKQAEESNRAYTQWLNSDLREFED